MCLFISSIGFGFEFDVGFWCLCSIVGGAMRELSVREFAAQLEPLLRVVVG